MNWWYVFGNERHGPFSKEDLTRALDAGIIDRNILVCNDEDMSDWLPIHAVKAFQGGPAEALPPPS